MNRKEEKILLRLYSAIHAIPLPQGISGWASANVQSSVNYANDMARVQPVIEEILYYVRVGEVEEADRRLTALETYNEKRKDQNWEVVFPYPRISY